MGIYDRDGNLRTDMSDREASRTFWRWIITIVVVLLIGTFVAWGTGVITAPWVGRANAQKVIYNPLNQIDQYNHFFDLDADIHTDRTQIKNGVAQLKLFNESNPVGTPDPTGQIVQLRTQQQQVVIGASNNCTRNSNNYNADTQKYTEQNFLDKHLPTREDPTLCEVPS